MKKFVCMIVILVMVLGGCGKTGQAETDKSQTGVTDTKGKSVSQKEFTVENGLESVLGEELSSGKVSPDEYVQYTILGSFDSSILPEEYQGCAPITDLRSCITYAGDHYGELSDETKEALVSLITLSGLEFDSSKKTADVLMDNLLEDAAVYAGSFFGMPKANINCVKVSENEHFIIWYSTEGKDAIDDSRAEEIAAELEDYVDFYEEQFGFEFDYQEEVMADAYKAVDQCNVLKKNGYDEDLLKSALSVYVFDYSKDNTVAGLYWYADTLLSKIGNWIFPGENGVYILPYIVIDADAGADQDDERMNTVAHELFHHYQNQIFAEEGELMSKGDQIGMEAAACWAAGLAVETSLDANTAMANTVYIQHLDDVYGFLTENKAADLIGYATSSFLYNIQMNVDDAVEKIVDSVYEEDYLSYLQDHTTETERNNTMNALAGHSFAQDYDNNSFNAMPGKSVVIEELTPADSVVGKTIAKAGVHYYCLHQKDLTGKTLTLSTRDAHVEMALFEDSFNPSQAIGSTFLNSYSLDLDIYAGTSQDLVLAVYNTSFVDSTTYSLYFSDSAGNSTGVSAGVSAGENATGTTSGAAWPIASGSVVLSEDSYIVLDDEHLKITVSNIRISPYAYSENEFNLIFDYEAENKTSSPLTAEPDNCYLNRYKIFNYSGDITLQAGEKVIGNYRSGTYQRIDIGQFTAEEIANMELGYTIELGDGTEYQSDVYKITFHENETSLLDAYNTHLDPARSVFHFAKVLGYDCNVGGIAGCNITGIMVLEADNGSHSIAVELENTGDKESRMTDIRVSQINGVECAVWGSNNPILPGHRQLIYIDMAEYTYADHEKYFGFSSIGSYRITLGYEDFSHTISCGAVSGGGGTVVYEDADYKLYFTGAVAHSYDSIYLYFRADISAAEFERNEWNSLYFDDRYNELFIDGAVADTYACKVALRDSMSAFVWIELDDVDPSVPHQITGNITTRVKDVPLSIEYVPNQVPDED